MTAEFRAVSLSQAAARLKMSESNLGNQLRWGKIKGTKVLGRWCVPLREVQRLERARNQRERAGKLTLIHVPEREQAEGWIGPELEVLVEGLKARETYARISERLAADGFTRSPASINKFIRRLGLTRRHRR